MRGGPRTSGTLLVIDDEPTQIETYCKWFEESGFTTYACLGLPELRACIERGAKDYWEKEFSLEDIDVAVIDYALSGGESGLNVARWIATASDYSVRRFLFSGHAETPDFRNAWLDERVIDDFGTKREERETIVLRIKRLIDLRRRERRIQAGVLVADKRLRKITDDVVSRIGPSLMPVLILGPSGSGKESIALRIHEASGLSDPFVPVNCGAFDAHLMRSELFGHTSGAFTDAKGHKLGLILEAAGFRTKEQQQQGGFLEWLRRAKPKDVSMVEERGVISITHTSPETRGFCGTIFLDEFADLSDFAQGLLLRLLDGYGFSPVGYHGTPLAPRIRFVAATNKAEILDPRTKAIRQDLIWRLAGWVLEVPGLAERGTEVVLGTAEQYVEELNRNNRSVLLGRQLRLSEGARQAIEELFGDERAAGTNAVENHLLKSGNFRSLRWLISRAFWIAFGQQRSSSIGRETIKEAAQSIKLKLRLKDPSWQRDMELDDRRDVLSQDEAKLLQKLMESGIESPWDLRNEEEYAQEMNIDYSVFEIIAKSRGLFAKAKDRMLFDSPGDLKVNTIGASRALHRWSYLVVLGLLWQCRERNSFLWKDTDELLDIERSQVYLKNALGRIFRAHGVEIQWTGGRNARGLQDLLLWIRGRSTKTGTTITETTEGSKEFRRWLELLSEKAGNWGLDAD